MRNILLFLFLLLPCAGTMAQDSYVHLIVWAKNGTKVAYALSENPKVTFSGSDLVITTRGVEVSYALENMARLTYEQKEGCAVKDVKTGAPLCSLNGEALVFPALKANSAVSVCSLDGTLVFREAIRQDGEYAFSVSSLRAGVYVVNVNGLTYKIMKR